MLKFDEFARYYTPLELAKKLGVHRRTIYRALLAGQLAGLQFGRLWRIPERAIMDWAK